MSDNTEWIDKVIPKIIKNIGLDVKVVRYELLKSERRIMSDINFVCIKYTNNINHLNEEQFVMIKTAIENTFVFMECQFHNEIIFYEMYCQPGENFPKYFYGHVQTSTSDEVSIIALEDVSKFKFKQCPISFNAPYEYVVAVMHELGRFHAKGYVMKEKKRTEFFRILDNIEETRYNETKGVNIKKFVNISAMRTVDYLRKHGHDKDFCNKLEALFSDSFDKVMITAIEPLEPLSTICHGDLTLDNFLFKAEDGGKFTAMLVDFALIRYSTPVIDLSTFFFLCCTNHMMRHQFFDILTVYHTALTNYMLQEGLQDIQKYSYDAILNDYKRGCLFGFILASFYGPYLWGYTQITVTQQTVESVANVYKTIGGDTLSETLVEMLLFIREIGGLDHIL